MHKNKKGFTLIEILAAVTILGILSIVAVVSVNNVIQKSKDNHYKAAEDNLELAGQSYVQQNRTDLPKVVGQKKKIPLKTLVEKNYIEPIKDYSDNDCDLENSYVQIFKYSQNDYSYLAYLDCPVYDSKEQLEHGAPRVTVTLTNPGSAKTAKANMKVEDSEKLLSWSYIVYRNGKEVLNSGSVMLPNYDKKVEKTVNISKYTPGKIKVVVTATNIYGLTTKKTSEVANYKDESAPTCIIKEEDKKENPKPWTQESKTITVGCDDGEGSGCTREEYSVTFKKTTDVGKITIEDESGNTTTCEVSVNVDVTVPECSVEFDGTKGDNSWYKSKNVTISIKPSDEHSGVSSYDLTTSTTPTYNNGNNKSQGDTTGITWYGYVKDNVGNVAKCNNTLKVDTTKPQCTVSLSGTKGNNGWFKAKPVTVKLNPTDNLSGVQQTGLSTDTKPTLGNTKTGTQSDTASVTWYGRVKDNAGNISNVCDSGVFKVDTVNPTCSVSFSGTSGDNGWYKSHNATVSLTTNDSLSKVENYGLTTSSTATYDGTSTASQGNTASQKWNGYVMDYAGNVNSCNDSVKVDTSNPSCTITLSGTPGNNGWYKSNNVTVTLKPSDSGPSEVATTGLSTSSSPSLDGSTSKSQGNTGGVTYYGRVKDKAGNISDVCNSGSFKVDTASPTLTWDTDPGPHNNSNGITVRSTCSDTMSGVASQTASSNVSSPTTGTSQTHTCTDNAGNTSSTTRTFKVRTYGRHSSCGVELYKSCENSECGVNSYKSCPHSSCGIASYKSCTHSSCGIASYKSCTHSSCGTETCSTSCSGIAGSPATVNSSACSGYTASQCTCGYTTSTQVHCTCSKSCGYKSCEHSSCGVSSYKSCPNSSCGVSAYKSCPHSSCGIESYKTCRTPGCGVEQYKECWHY